MASKYKILALFGKAGAGKNYIKDMLLKKTENEHLFHSIISTTTRPKRDKEIDGVDYYFVSNEDFAKKIFNGTMLEATSFKDWFYGTTIDTIVKDKINIGIFNITAIECLLSNNDLMVQPVYIVTQDDTIRLRRQLDRETNPDCEEICRRFLADNKDFLDIPFHYKIINNKQDTEFNTSAFNFLYKNLCADFDYM